MKRSIPILFTLITVIVCGLLGPAPSGAQKEVSGVSVKKDGDAVLLTPRDPGKIFLVYGCPRQERGRNSTQCSARLTYLVGEQRFLAKEYSKIVILEVQQLTEMDLLLEPSGLQVKEETTQKPPSTPPPPPKDTAVKTSPKVCLWCDKLPDPRPPG